MATLKPSGLPPHPAQKVTFWNRLPFPKGYLLGGPAKAYLFKFLKFDYKTGPRARSYSKILKRLPFVLENPRVSVLPCGNKFV
jgi:hypothetical protein